ncbi:MAG TPA: DUF2059 domain-containing protein [Steroidobacteraceae bacterium]|nr:DUF2059 domain-containing protein [Steroidobacteraceae bacterium]
MTATLATALACSAGAFADDARDAPVRQLLVLTGVLKRTRVLTTQLVERLQAENPDVPAALWSNFGARVSDDSTVLSLYGPAYERHLSQGDIRALVAFFGSPLGQRLLVGTDRLQDARQAASQRWAARVAEDLLESRAHSDDPPAADAGGADDGRSIPDDIRELIRVSGTLAEARSMSALMIDRLKDSHVDDEVIGRAQQRLADGRALSESWIPAYAEAFRSTDVRALIRFYRGPLGRRWVAALPEIRTETLESARALSDEIAHRAIREVLGPLPQWRLMHPDKVPAGEGAGSR